MPSDRQRTLKIVAMATVLILSFSALVLGWLYLGAIEFEKDRLAYLSIMHAHDLEAMSKMGSRVDEMNVSQKFIPDRIQELFDSRKELHHFGKTGEVIFVRRQEDVVVGFSALPSGHAGISQSLLLPGNSISQLQLNFSGKSRREILPDGRGNVVLAAYEPLLDLPMVGVVAKVNIQEIQFPYLLAGGGLWLVEIGIMVLTGLMIVRSKNFSGQDLPQDEAKLRAVIACAGEGIVTFDEYGTIETFNETAEAMFSWQASEVIGMPFRSLFISSEHDACDLFLLTYQPSGKKRIGGLLKEFYAKRKDGTVFPLTLTLTEAPIWGHRLFTALLRNVTEQKLAERRLAAQYAVARVLADCTTIQQATPEILRAVCESLGWQLGVLWQVEPGSRFLRCVEVWKASPDRFSEFVAVTQGMSFSKGVGLPGRIWEIGEPIWIPDAVKDPNFPRAPMAAQAGLHAAFAFPIRLGVATHGVMEFFSREIQEPDEALLHQMVSVGSQIGQFMQRKETETALRESEEQTRLILDTALDAVVTVDGNGQIIGWNTQAERMFGWTRQEIVGQPLVSTLIPEKYRNAHLLGMQRYLISEVSEILNNRIELSGLHRDGHEFPLEIAITAVRSKGGTIFSGFLRDLTERRRTEDALLKSEEQRRQAQKMEAMGTLAGGIAHDFNNILSAIIGYTELAMTQIGKGSSVLPRLQEVLRAGYRAKNLVRQILTFSRQGESGKKVIYLQPIVEEALNLLRISLPSTITLHAELQSDLAPVLADATQIHQVVMNLGANAEYAMRATGGSLVVKLDEVEIDGSTASLFQGLHGGAYIRLKVSDTGQGMSPSVKKRIFDPFFTTKDVGEGTGMGLAVIHGVVTSHGGAIRVDSQKGEGTTFTIYFPCSSVPVVGQQGSSVPPSYCGQGTVMFVDDEVSIINWAKDMLEELGYVVVVFTNGPEALQAFQQEPDRFDVLVTDQTMPGMTGDLLARQIMSIRPGFPVILCSGFSYTMNEEKALVMGLRAYLTKPVLMSDMAQALQAALDRSFPHKTS
jgi:PAS domain S-box-containing protein